MPGDLFIINPAAGHGRAAGVWEGVKEQALRLGPGSRFAFTGRAGHAGELALAAALEGSGRIIAVGGDGTFCEALQGVMAAPEGARRRVVMGAIPAGSGCDLARHLRCPTDRDGIIDMLARGRPRALDVGRVNYTRADGTPGERYFINIAAFGLAGDVAHHIKKMGKPLGGTVSYAVSSVWSILAARAKDLRLKADGRDISGRCHLGVLANTSSMGGGMLVAPGTKDDDGLMDLVLVADMSRLALVRKFPLLYKGAHLGTPGVSLTGLRRLEADSDETVWLNIDGEAEGRLPAVFEVLPGAVKVIAP
jgi:YegS/Rv2252/BmrU family lipid kinase